MLCICEAQKMTIPVNPVDGGVAVTPGPRSIQNRAHPINVETVCAGGGQAYVGGGEREQDDGIVSVRLDEALDLQQLPSLVASRMYGDGEGTVWDRVARPHRDCMCYLGPPTTLMPM